MPDQTECVPDVRIQLQLVPIPADLIKQHDNPVIPSAGDNAALLDWAMACAVNTRLYKEQTTALQGLGRTETEGEN